MSIIRFNNGSGYFSGDISANDVSFNNVEIKTDLNDNDTLIKYVSGNSYIWSDNNVEEVARNDASFNVVVWRRVSQGGRDNYLVSSEFQLFIGGQNILPSGYELYNSDGFDNRATTFYRWNTKVIHRAGSPYQETSLFNSNIDRTWGYSLNPQSDNSLIIFLKSSYNIKDIQSIVVYAQLETNGSVIEDSKRAKGTILELYNDTNDASLNNPLISTHKIDTEELYHAYRWDFPAIINYNNFTNSLSTTQIYNNDVYKFTTKYIDSNLFFEVLNNTSIDNVHILPNPSESDVSLNKYNLIAPVPTQTFNVVVWRRVITTNYIISSEIQLWINDSNILPSDYEVYNDGGFNSRATSGYRWNSKALNRGPDTARETKLFDSNFSGWGRTYGVHQDNSIIIFLKSSHNVRDIQSIVVYTQLLNGVPNGDNVNARYNNGTILELYNDTNDVNLNNPLLSTNVIDDTHKYDAYRWDFPAIIGYNNFSNSPSTTQICDNNVYNFTTNYSNYLFDIKYLYSQITPTYINNIQSIITYSNLVLYSDDTSFGYYSNKGVIKRFDFANIGSYTKDFSNNDLTNYIPKGETTIAEIPKVTTLYNNGLMGVTTFKDNVNINGDLHINGSIGILNVNKIWKIGDYVDENIGFFQNYTVRGWIEDGSTNVQMNFTGQHRTFVDNIPYKKAETNIGLIVCSNKNTYINMSNGIKKGNKAITINESLPVVSLSTKIKDKSCFGVISSSEDPEIRVEKYGCFCSPFEKEEGDIRIFINSVGEGAIWVTNKNGNLEAGDYITTSDIPGYGMKQEDDFLHNYTVAKITMDCNFNPEYIKKETILKDVSGINILDVNGQIQFTNEEITNEEITNEKIYEYAYEIRYLDISGNIITKEEYDIIEEKYIAAFVGCTYHCG